MGAILLIPSLQAKIKDCYPINYPLTSSGNLKWKAALRSWAIQAIQASPRKSPAFPETIDKLYLALEMDLFVSGTWIKTQKSMNGRYKRMGGLLLPENKSMYSRYDVRCY